MISLRIEESIADVSGLPTKKSWYLDLYKSCNAVLGKEAPRIDINIVLDTDEHVKELNAKYRKLKKTTDVLSFYYGDDGKTGEGEVLVAIPYAARQAKRLKHSLENEMARLVVHGIFHVYGYDHMKAGERKIMRALEDKALGLK